MAQIAVENVYVNCDNCKKATPSGIRADPATLADTSNTLRNNRTRCGHWGQMVLWSKAELWLESVVPEQFSE